MSVILSIIISILVLLVMVGQWYLQRMQQIHNEKSVKPLGQIYFWDRDKTIAIRIVNNGLGPLMIDRIMFYKSDTIYSSIVDCVDLPARSFMHDSSDDPVKRVILPGAYLTVFEATLAEGENESSLDRVREQLKPITLKVACRDIYDNNIILERDFQWFVRHMLERT